jgi:hypothetical protein
MKTTKSKGGFQIFSYSLKLTNQIDWSWLTLPLLFYLFFSNSHIYYT